MAKKRAEMTKKGKETADTAKPTASMPEQSDDMAITDKPPKKMPDMQVSVQQKIFIAALLKKVRDDKVYAITSDPLSGTG